MIRSKRMWVLYGAIGVGAAGAWAQCQSTRPRPDATTRPAGPERASAHAEGTIKSLNYSPRGDVNGVILESGEVIFIDPRSAHEMKLAVNQKVSVDGQSHRGGDVTVLMAESVNGTTVHHPRPPMHGPRPDGQDAGGPGGPPPPPDDSDGPPHRGDARQGHRPPPPDEYRQGGQDQTQNGPGPDDQGPPPSTQDSGQGRPERPGHRPPPPPPPDGNN